MISIEPMRQPLRSSSTYKSNRYRCLLRFLLTFLYFSSQPSSVWSMEKICGEFISEKLNSTKGTFAIDKELSHLNDSFLCVYKFVAKKNQKVLLNFNHFDVKSIAPECINEFVDIYIEANDLTINNYIETNFLSRFCGWKKPNVLVSYYNTIIIVYHSDGVQRGTSFHGTFEFVDAAPYNVGRKSEQVCEYEFRSENLESGVFMSPTYPGTYPNLLNCTYRFIGQPNERISIVFEEISIHYGADHCPYDTIKVYDFTKNENAKALLKTAALNRQLRSPFDRYNRKQIDYYCGKKQNFTLYSSMNLFEINFEMFDSLGNEEYAEHEDRIMLRKGFKAYFTFSKYYANLSFITGKHIPGTNCDQRITSIHETGVIYSPNYFGPYSINATCKYIFEGLNDRFNLELIKLNFLSIDLKQSLLKNVCNENQVSYLGIYGSERQPNSKFCFNYLNSDTREIRSASSQMTIEFNSIVHTDLTHQTFKASYTFFTDYGIEGTKVYPNRTCLYTFNGRDVIHGYINSPRYPNNYPLNMRCTYLFDIATKYERILFTYKDFRLASPDQNCKYYDDNLSIYQSKNAFEDIEEHEHVEGEEKEDYYLNDDWQKVYKHCGTKTPAPFITDPTAKQLKFVFFSDSKSYAQGFQINYNYVTIPECKHLITTNDNLSSGQIVISNELEAAYYCDWLISSNLGTSILLSFKNDNFDLQTNQFVIRVYDLNPRNHTTNLDSASFESNYDEDANQRFAAVYEYRLDKATKYFQIDSNHIKIQLVYEKSLILSEGKLLINWLSAIKVNMKESCKDDEILCVQSGYCIKSTHYCNRVDDCPNDISDEPEKCFVETKQSGIISPPMLQLTSFIISILVLIVILTVCISCRIKIIRNRKKQIKQNSPNLAKFQTMSKSKLSISNAQQNYPPSSAYYKYSPANSVDYLEAAITTV